ncbi:MULTISPECIES: hypothetical protein [unclassified Spirosoma]|uniref:hypothetical protein n=1 Tax=unclassified Spirosoma TaxID=2621999 RepID=UPI000965C24E|nr:MULTISPECIES: hypothetical protein [unclassified Spirosoma]MBN8824423.1 hypothetical protein [Spirosoma sp.]OJW70114.1 MAG: hypothetical protein BGO59_25915 [Spirosoma sp. 48-14]
MAEQTQPAKKAMQFTIDEEIAEVNREIGLRYGFYKKKVDANQMTQMDADYRIGVMTSALNRLKALKFLLSNISNPY